MKSYNSNSQKALENNTLYALVSLVIIGLLTVVFLSLSPSQLKGDVEGGEGEGEVQQEETCLDQAQYNTLFNSTKSGIQGLGSINLDDNSVVDSLTDLIEAVYTLKSAEEDECDETEPEGETISDLITELNTLIPTFNNKGPNEELPLLENITYSCDEGREFDEDTTSCVDIVEQCEYEDDFARLKNAYELLYEYRNKPNDFKSANFQTLKGFLTAIETQNFKPNLGNTFTYLTEGSGLATNIMNSYSTIITADGCEDLADNSVFKSFVITVPEALSCPTGAIEDAGKCYCVVSGDEVSVNGSCNVVQPANNQNSDKDEDKDDKDNEIVCENGMVVDDIDACDLVAAFNPNSPEAPDLSPLETNLPDKDTSQENNDANQTENDEENDSPTPSNDENNDDTEDDIPENTRGSADSGLLSNTNPNTLAANVVKGNTGPSIWLTILITSLIGTTYIISQKN